MKNALILKRFCGEEQYPVQIGTWSIEDDVLSIELSFGPGANLHDDTAYLAEEPGWSLYFNITESLKPGMILTDNRDDETYLYYCECLTTYKNKVEILDIKDDRILVKITGECYDVNYYDGSKGNDILEVTTWLKKEKE